MIRCRPGIDSTEAGHPASIVAGSTSPASRMETAFSPLWRNFTKNHKFIQKGLAGLPAIPMFAAPKQGTRVFQAKCVILLGITESIS